MSSWSKVPVVMGNLKETNLEYVAYKIVNEIMAWANFI